MQRNSFWQFLKSYMAVTAMLVILSISTSVSANAPGLLKEGMDGEMVVKLHTILKEHGYYDDGIDGKFGSGTKMAVLSFQMDNNLVADGVAGPVTMQTLRDVKPSTSRANRAALGSNRGRDLVSFAKRFHGTPYVWAGSAPGGFDCSGYIYYVYSQYGVWLPRMADEQYEVGVAVRRSQLQEGDLVFFSTYEPGPSHVGIYIGGNQFIHASSGAGHVTVTPLDKPYYAERYLGAKRVIR